MAELPTPIAELSLRLARMGDDFPEPLERNSAHLFEVIVQYTAAVAISGYLRIDARDPRAEGAIKQLESMPTLGVWVQSIREITTVLGEPKLEGFVRPGLRDLVREYRAPATETMNAFGAVVRDLRGVEEGVSTHETQFETVAGFIDFLVAYRNRKAHGGARWFEQNAKALAVPLYRSIAALADAFSWISRYPLFLPKAVDPKSATFAHRGILLSGETPRRDVELDLPARHELDQILYDPSDLAISIAPFYTFLLCNSPLCYGPRVFGVIRGFGQKAQTYSHALCGTEIETSELAPLWTRVFRPRRQESRVSSVAFTQEIEPSDRAVRTGEPFRLRVRVRNFTQSPVYGIYVELALPKSIESIDEKAARRERLDPGKDVDFEYVFRTHEEGRVSIDNAVLRYTIEGGREISRPLPELSVPVAFNDFPGLVGRDAQLERLHAHYAHATARQARFAVVTGDSGTGKTALIGTFLERLAASKDRRPIILRARCYEEDLHPFAAVNLLLESFLVQYADREAVDRALKETTGAAFEELGSCELLVTDLLAVTSKVLGTSSPMIRRVVETSDEPIEWMDDGRRTELYGALADAFRTIAGKAPLVLYLEDIQALHKDAWRLLRFLMRQVERKPVLLLACLGSSSSRDDLGSNVLAPGEVRPALHQLNADFVELQPLPEAEMAALFDLLLPQHAISPKLRDSILEFARGLPSWLVETVRVLRSRGHIVRDDGAWKSVAEDVAISEAFADVIRERHDALDPVLRRVVHNAAVLGKRFSREMLAELPIDRDRKLQSMELSQSLRQLEEIHHILQEKDVDIEFAHARIHDIIYTKITPAMRRELHRCVAEVLEAKKDPARWCLQLVHHWTRAEDRGRALEYLELGAERLEKSMAYEEACRMLEKALETVTERPELRDENWRFDVVRKLARLEWLSGNVDHSTRLDLENVERGKELRRFRDVCAVLRALSITQALRGDFERARRVAIEAKDIAVRHNLHEAEQLMNLQLGSIARDRRQFEEAEALFQGCLSYAAAAKLPWMEADANRQLGVLLRMKGELSAARKCFERAIVLFEGLERSNRLFGLGMTYDNLSGLSRQVGELAAAEAEMEKSLQYRRLAKDSIGLSRGLFGQAKLLFSRGRVVEAQAKIAESIEIKKKLEDDEGIAKCRELEGQILAERDQWNAALEAFREAIALYERLKMGFKTHRIRLACARVHLAMGQQAEADAIVERVSAPDGTAMDAATRVDLALVEADIARRARDFAAAEHLLAAVLPTLQDVMDDALRNQVDILYALISMEVGRHDRAVSLLEAGLTRKACRENPFIAARFFNLLGKALRKAGHFDRACAVLKEGLEVIRTIDDPLGEALAFDELGKVELDRRRFGEARAWFEKGLAVKRRIDDERGIQISKKLLEDCHQSTVSSEPPSSGGTVR